MANHPNIKNPGPKAPEVKAVREEWGFTQVSAAALLGWGERGWQYLESGERKLTALQWKLWKHIAGIEQMPFTKRKSGDEREKGPTSG